MNAQPVSSPTSSGASGLSAFRQQHPEYNDLGDQDLADKLHAKFYSDVPKDVYYKRLGLGATASAPVDPATAAFNAGQQSGQGDNWGQALATQFAQQASFGTSNYLSALVRYGAQRLMGVRNPDDLSTSVALARGNSAGDQVANPVAGTIGGVLGGLVGGGELGQALRVARMVPGGGAVLDALAPKAGQAVRNVVKAVGTNFGVGAGITAANQNLTSVGDLVSGIPQDALGGAVSAVAGPVAGKAATMVISRLQPAAARAMQALASHLSEAPADLEQAFQAFQHLTGTTPSMADITGLKSQGLLQKLAKANATIGEAANVAANAGGAPLHEQLAALAARNPQRPQTASELDALRNATTDAAMNTPHPNTGLTLNDTPAPDLNGHLLSPHVEYALSPNTQVNARLNRPNEVLQRIQSGQQTIGDVDTVRRALRDQQNAFIRPAPGSMSARDPILAKEFGDLANKVEGIGVNADSDYGKVLDNYRGLSNYTNGFQHGLAGNGATDIPRDDTLLARAMKSQMGQAGYEHGNALHVAQAALDAIKPNTVNPQAQVGPGHVAQAAMAAASGGVGFIYHAMRAIPGLHLSEGVQQIIAKQLFDPQMTAAGVANLRRAGATDANIRLMGATIGGVTGAKLANFTSQGQQQ